jgi:hypothetical protein
MTHRDFVYWLQGFMEISDPKSIDEKSLEIIREHMRLVSEKQNSTTISASPMPYGTVTIC